MKVKDLQSGESLGPNKSGEICFKGTSFMSGYYKNPEATKNAFDEDGWFLSGDIGYYDENGEIYIVERIKEMIKCRNYAISPSDIEQLLHTHPGVMEAAVVPMPHEIDIERPIAERERENKKGRDIVHSILRDEFRRMRADTRVDICTNETTFYDYFKSEKQKKPRPLMTYRPREIQIDITETSLVIIEDDLPNDSRERDFNEDPSTRNIINTETKDVKEKVTGGDANELETQIDSESVEENEIGTNTVIVLDNVPVTFILQPCTQSENPQNLQSSVKHHHSDSDVQTSNRSCWDSRPSTSSPNSMPRHNSLESVTTTNSNNRSTQNKPFPCDMCNKSYTRKHDRTRHKLRDHTRNKPHICPDCGQGFSRLGTMTTHRRIHTDSVTTTNSNNRSTQDKPYPCNLCNQSFARKHDRTRHMLTHTGDKPHKCPECDQQFSRFDTMTAHRRIHTGEKPFKCPQCEYAASRKNAITRHMKTHSTDRVLDSSSSSGARPTSPDSSQARPATEPASNHSNEQQLQDQIAPQVDQDEMSPPDHYDKTIAPRYHPNLRCIRKEIRASSHSPSPHKAFTFTPHTDRLQKCDENWETELDEMKIGCEFVDVKPDLNSLAVKKIEGDANELETKIDSVFVEKNEIRTNTDLVHNDDQLSLSFNLKYYTPSENPQNLQSSVKRCHSDSDVQTSNWSPWDSRPSTSSPNSRHRRRSAQDRPYPCNLCNRSFTRLSHLTRHMLIHNGYKPYRCNLCNQSFTRNDELTRHMLTHTGDKTHKCPQCGQGFNRIDNMTAHRRIHTGEKPFKCPQCEYAASRKYAITRHMKTHSTDRVSGSSSGASPAEPARQELPESSSSGYETIWLQDHIAPQVDQDEMSPPDHDDKTIAPRYHPNLLFFVVLLLVSRCARILRAKLVRERERETEFSHSTCAPSYIASRYLRSAEAAASSSVVTLGSSYFQKLHSLL
ncbi:unnamed protein product, partial [Trichogramma brassicae]